MSITLARMSTTTPIEYTKTDRIGAIAVAAGAAIWGLFWLPLRYLSDLGVTGLWAVAMVMGTAAIPSVLLMWWQKESSDLLLKDTWLTSVALAMATVLYFTGILYSDVIRVIFLFYLLPLWTTLSARLIYGEPISRAKILVIATALSGLWLLLGGGSSLPVPKNIGDWCGIAAGLCWGVSLSLLRGRAETRPFAVTSTTLLAALILSAALAAILHLTGTASVEPAAQAIRIDWPTILGLASLFGALILFPALLGQVWGARRIPAPTAALLTMTEILVATVSAGLIIGTDLPPIAWLGGGIIVLAVCIDLITHTRQD